MRLRISILIFAVAFLIGCSGGGTSQVAGGGTPAPAPGPQGKTRVTMRVDLGPQAREIQATGLPFILVVAEVVDRNQMDPGTLSKHTVVATGQASVAPEDTSVLIRMDVPPGDWDVYVFGIDELANATASSPQQVIIGGAQTLSLLFNLVGGTPIVTLSSVQTVFNVPGNMVTVGDPTLLFTANAFFTDGTMLTNVAPSTFVSSDPAVLQVDPNTGVAQALAPGMATVRATFQGLQDPTGVTVTVNAVPSTPRFVTLVSGADTLNTFPLDTTTGNIGALLDSEPAPVPGSFLGSGRGSTLDTVFYDSGASVMTFTVDQAGMIVARNTIALAGFVRDLVGNGNTFYVGADAGSNDTAQAFTFDDLTNLFNAAGPPAATPDALSSLGVSSRPVLYITNHSASRDAFALNLDGNGNPTVQIGPGFVPLNPTALPTIVKSVPGANFVLVASNDPGGATVNALPVDATGALTNGMATGGANTVLPNVNALAVSPDGRFAYLVNSGGPNTRIDVFTMDPTGDGSSLAMTSFVSLAAGAQVFDVDIDPTGNFLYATDFGSASVQRFTIDPANGSLSAQTTALSQIGVFQSQILP